MIDPSHLAATVAWGGFALAFVLGFVASRANVCAMGAISDVVNMQHWGRMRTWLLAVAVAIVGASLLHAFGLVDLAKSIFQRPRLNWLSALVGGVTFGAGMTLAGGCANKTLIRIGGGSLRSLVVFAFLGISAYMTLRGLFGQWRVTFLDPVSLDLTRFGLKGQDLPTIVAKTTSMDARTALLVLAALVAGGLFVFIFGDGRFRQKPDQVAAGILIGLIVTAGWYLTGHLGYAENPDTLEMTFFGTNSHAAESLSFVGPIAYTLELLLLWSDKSLGVSFGIATALGSVAGALAWALYSKRFRIEGFANASDTWHHLVGAVLMGFGGVTALGCTFGQGITGVSTLSVGSLLTMGAIVAGAIATMKYQYWREMRAG
ncbi:MAG TPA: YeeE/YedE family protein [Burkholderiaceae bacterium]|nr:YeeE/YedE family protein [Burkholderiaceae bacterium]